MATPVNAVSTFNTVGIREDLEGVIFRVAPEETPFTSQIGTAKATQKYHEWQTESIDAPEPRPTQYEGSDANPEAGNFSVRLGNYSSHFERSWSVTGAAQDSKAAGRSDEMERQVVLKGLALKRDQEAGFLGNYASTPEVPNSTPRASAGALAFIQSNTNRNTGGVSGGFANGIVSAATPAGSTRPFTEVLLKSTMNQIYTSTGKSTSRAAFLYPTLKQEAAAFTGLAQARRETGNKKAVIIGGADLYVSDFGEVTFVPSIFASTRDVLVADLDMWAVATFRPTTTVDLAKTGDSEKKMIFCDKTLVCRNEKASGVIADVQ